MQWCRGVDGRVEPARIAAEVRRLGDFDVVCLQEVAQGFSDPGLAGADGSDQFAFFADAFPGYAMVAGTGVDLPADATGADRGRSRKRFGNLILTRLPLNAVLRHTLPWPDDPVKPSMPRMALEASVETSFGGLRVVTTHLEYFSAKQRGAQVAALRGLFAEGFAHAGDKPRDDGSPFRSFARPRHALFVGDFNMPATDPGYAAMTAPFDDGTPALVDAWAATYRGVAQPPTFCVHKPYQPGMKPYACDFAFVDAPLAGRVREVVVDVDTRASDHQPVAITLA